ncbi:hypothetical protein ACFQ3P_32990 [Paraburkholderia sabiae]|uniref:Uncharacterized protein n=1 Tax=Paraburkholderia sabiae TaxID=273251 RepID=A0ABU9QJ91_9BURK|nr:hypothetical protein [Paraburkholderia sabiae]WJZ79770.1 hypothetical protein QEN71_43820 [Paraburkholderia sabiae]CAD6559307.1 hypothetical protein LMG24235_06630 [Paraburkholderia sabiae]
MAEAGFKDKEALAALAVQEQTLYVQDTANARNDKVFWLGVVILATFAVVVFASMYGAYALLAGHVVVENAALVGMVAGFVGTVIGYVSANAQQVVGFFYGSSKGSETKTDAMAAAFTQTFSPTPDRPGSPTPGGNTT